MPTLAASPPRPLTPLIGREREIETVRALLRRQEVRLVTISGAGGSGKTRLALELAGELAGEFADGVAFVPLAALTDPALVPSTIAHAIGVRESGTRSAADALAADLVDKEFLLICDNFESVADAAPFLVRLIAVCPRLRVLATSRASLRVTGERVVPLPPLAISESAASQSVEELSSIAAIRLFVSRASAVNPSLALTSANLMAIAEICRRLDGLPLALELAAARVKVLSPPALLNRLGNRLTLLTGGSRDLPARQQTMRDAIAWSYDLLDPQEQTLFRRLSVFIGGFSLEAAETVCGSQSPIDVLDGIGSLVEKSLVEQRTPIGDETATSPRYGLLETIREFGSEQLAAQSAESDAVRRAHADWYLALVERVEPHLHGQTQHQWGQLLETEHGNLRAALGWLEQTGDAESSLRMTGTLSSFWWFAGHLREGRDWLERALARGGDASVAARTRALEGTGFIAQAQGDTERAVAVLEEGLSLYRSIGDRRGAASALYSLGVEAEDSGNYGQAHEFLTESLALVEELGDLRSKAFALLHLGIVAYGREDDDAAIAYSQAGIAAAQEFGSNVGFVLGTFCLALVASRRGDYAQAIARYREIVNWLDSSHVFAGPWPRRGIDSVGRLMNGVATIAASSGHLERAARLFGAAAADHEAIGTNPALPERTLFEQATATARTRLGEDAFNAAWATGWAMTPADARADIESVLTGIGPRHVAPVSAAASVGLTEREQEVLKLLANKLSDKEIGSALFISHRTAMGHVANIFKKLGVSSRADAVEQARQLGLL